MSAKRCAVILLAVLCVSLLSEVDGASVRDKRQSEGTGSSGAGSIFNWLLRVLYGQMCTGASNNAIMDRYCAFLASQIGVIPGNQEVTCATMCTMQMDPVCASDGNDYGNECLMLVAAACRGTSLSVAYKGFCVTARA